MLVTPQTWRPKSLGCNVLTLRTPTGATITLELFDGGGIVCSTAVWRLAGRIVAMALAGSA